jgi:hypothetical protein
MRIQNFSPWNQDAKFGSGINIPDPQHCPEQSFKIHFLLQKTVAFSLKLLRLQLIWRRIFI